MHVNAVVVTAIYLVVQFTMVSLLDTSVVLVTGVVPNQEILLEMPRASLTTCQRECIRYGPSCSGYCFIFFSYQFPLFNTKYNCVYQLPPNVFQLCEKSSFCAFHKFRLIQTVLLY